MRKQVAILAAAALSVCTSGFDAAGEGKPPALEARSFAVPGHGSLALPVPAAWKQEVNQPPTDPSPTITFSPASGDDFKVLVTPLWSPTNDPNFNKPQAVRRLIDNETRKMLPSAVEKELAVKEFKGAAGTGYYYLATDKAPKPGEYPYMVRALAGAGDLLLSVTVLCRAKDSPAIADTLRALQQAAPHKKAEDSLATYAIVVPGEGWRISFDSPALAETPAFRKNGASDYAFRGNSGRFNISIFVETPQGPGKTPKACHDFYWPKASRNPLIAKDTVAASHTPEYYRVQYDIVTDLLGRAVRQKNVNYYLAFRGRWIDVHISIMEPVAGDEKVFAAFDKSLRCGD
jgi:hypothetical protein